MRNTRAPRSIALGAFLSLAAMTCAGAHAQSDAPPPPPGRDVFYMRTGGGPMGPDDAIGFVGFEGELGGKTVTGAPFTATISTQTTQALADGNHIDRSNSGTMARDSHGRTRRDMTLTAMGAWGTSGQAVPHVVFINDNVAGARYILQPDKKIARKMQRMGGPGKRSGANSPDAQSGGPRWAGNRGDAGTVTRASLGTQTINGVQAEGTRVTRTIPAGAIGNASAIVITNERWYSPELQTVVMTKRSDPMTGDDVSADEHSEARAGCVPFPGSGGLHRQAGPARRAKTFQAGPRRAATAARARRATAIAGVAGLSLPT